MPSFPLTRRHLLASAATCLGAAALDSLSPSALASGPVAASTAAPVVKALHIPPRAKRIIYLFMAGGQSQIELLDHKPAMQDMFDKDLPEGIRKGQRITTMTSGQLRLPIVPSKFGFSRHGANGTWIGDLLPHTASIVDDITIVRSMHTDAINHDPAITFIQTGSQLPGRPSLGAWLSYGVGSENQNLPAFVVLTSKWSGRKNAQALFSRLWGSGFLPSNHQGVALRNSGDPILYLSNPNGVAPGVRRNMLDSLAELNQHHYANSGDPEVLARVSQYEMAFRMQTSAPETVDFSDEPQHILDMYGPDVLKPGTFAASCLLARRLAERDVRMVQVFHRGWDQHYNLPRDLAAQANDIDQGSAALVKDLKQRGMLDDTLVVCGGEFGRTTYCQGRLSSTNYGRDHHPRCFSIWMAGGGVKAGAEIGLTDEFSYNINEDPIHVHDLNATILHLLGIDHEKLTYRFQGRDFRLTDVHGTIVKKLLA